MIARATRSVQDAWDGYFSALYQPVVWVVFVLVLIYNWWHGQQLADEWEPWTITEWLISYAPGFVRRGLGGEVLLFINRQTGWSLNMLALGTIVVLFAAFFLAFTALIWRKRLTFWYFALCLSPGFVLFTFYNPKAVGRKELLIFVAFAVWAIFAGGYRRGVRFHLAFAVAAFVLTLVHEMFFFFTPYFVLLAYLVARERTGGIPAREMWTDSFLVPAASAIAAFLVVRFSASLGDPALCDRLVLLGAPTVACGGALDFHNATMQEAWAEFAGRFNQDTVRSLAMIFPFVLVPLYLFLAANTNPMAAPKSHAGSAPSPLWLTGVAALAIVFSSPLFVLAIDWGRWISIHAILLTIVCATYLPTSDTPTTRRRVSPATAVSLLAGLAVLASLFSWSFKYCCSSDYLIPLGPLDAIVRTWNDLEL